MRRTYPRLTEPLSSPLIRTPRCAALRDFGEIPAIHETHALPGRASATKEAKRNEMPRAAETEQQGCERSMREGFLWRIKIKVVLMFPYLPRLSEAPSVLLAADQTTAAVPGTPSARATAILLTDLLTLQQESSDKCTSGSREAGDGGVLQWPCAADRRGEAHHRGSPKPAAHKGGDCDDVCGWHLGKDGGALS